MWTFNNNPVYGKGRQRESKKQWKKEYIYGTQRNNGEQPRKKEANVELEEGKKNSKWIFRWLGKEWAVVAVETPEMQIIKCSDRVWVEMEESRVWKPVLLELIN